MLAACNLATAAEPASRDYCNVVRDYADCMIAQGRDTYGEVHSPLFAAALDRTTYRPGTFPSIEGIRRIDRTTTGANPMQDENLYQVLFALSEATGEPKYAAEADQALKFFFETCQSPTTGLLAWGEHLGWDFQAERCVGNDTHEFARPWVLWERCFRLAPEPCVRLARGLWEHQIGDPKTGNFSRHARYSAHGPGIDSQYPRHGGFYILTWAQAYRHTQDPYFLKAIETVLAHFETRRNPTSGAIPAESASRSRETVVWPESTLSLAVDLESAAALVPEEIAATLRASAAQIDEVYLKIAHDLSPNGVGFISNCDARTLEPLPSGSAKHTEPWATQYGVYTDAQVAMIAYLRWQQLPDSRNKEGYRRLILASADRYLHSEPDPHKTLYPGALGDVVLHLLSAYELSGEPRYLERADHFAKLALECLLTDGSPLPRASSRHEHYEAITRADTLMLALLKLWQVQNRPQQKLSLIYCDR